LAFVDASIVSFECHFRALRVAHWIQNDHQRLKMNGQLQLKNPEKRQQWRRADGLLASVFCALPPLDSCVPDEDSCLFVMVLMVIFL
jgi:hypothetical protein